MASPPIVNTASTPSVCEEWGRCATLTPDSPDAKAAIQEIVESIADGRAARVRAFIESMPSPAPKGSNSGPGPGGSNQDTTYRFFLAFEQAPKTHRSGWVLGEGGYNDPDLHFPLRLCRTEDGSASAPPRSLIASIYMRQDTGAFMIQALDNTDPITYRSGNGNVTVTLSSGDCTVLCAKLNYLSFYHNSKFFSYVFEFEAFDEYYFGEARNKFIKESHIADKQILLHRGLDYLPKDGQRVMRGVAFHSTIGAGGFGTVKSGVNVRTGDPVAIKSQGYKTSEEKASIMKELNIANSFPQDTPGIAPVLDIWCDHGSSPPCYQGNIDVVHFTMPLARCDFRSVKWDVISDPAKLMLFWHTLQGLHSIHIRQIIHRDISPKNLLVEGIDPPRASICDFGKAVESYCAHGTYIGPPHTLAPEVRVYGYYSAAIDIWSLAYTWLCALTKVEQGDSWVEEHHQSLLKKVDELKRAERISSSFAILMRSMLAYDPSQRPTTTKAMQDCAWDAVVNSSEINVPNKSNATQQVWWTWENKSASLNSLTPLPDTAPQCTPLMEDGESGDRATKRRCL